MLKFIKHSSNQRFLVFCVPRNYVYICVLKGDTCHNAEPNKSSPHKSVWTLSVIYNYNFVGISPYFSHAVYNNIYFSTTKGIFLANKATDNFDSMKEKVLNAMFSSLKFI
jgi:hypothetical protein